MLHGSTGAIRKGFQQEAWNVIVQRPDPASPRLPGCLCGRQHHWLTLPCGQRASLTDGEAGRQLPRDGDRFWRVSRGTGQAARLQRAEL